MSVTALTLLLSFIALASGQITVGHREALSQLWTATNGPNWDVNSNWDTSNITANVCEWHGVLCNLNDTRIEVLFLGFNGLDGTLPTHIGALDTVTDLMFQENPFLGGQIPNEVGNMPALSLMYMFECNFVGTLPNTLGQMTSLTQFLFYNNSIGGVIPNDIGSAVALEQFIGSGNQISGTIPTSIADLPLLSTFYMDRNQLTGELPVNLPSGAISDSITFVKLEENQLSGPIPELYALISGLAIFEAQNNNFGCFIPDFIVSGNFFLNIENNPFLCPVPTSLVGQDNAPTCVPSDSTSLAPDEVPDSYTGTFTLQGTGFQPDCDLQVVFVRGVGAQERLYPAPISTFTSTLIQFQLPADVFPGTFTVELRNQAGLKRVGGVAESIRIVRECPGEGIYPGGCFQGSCTSTGDCICNTGYAGPACNLTCEDVITCQNGGTCSFVGASTQAFCTCINGFAGQNCQIGTCNPACAVTGTCAVDTGAGSASCVCDPGYEGPTCGDEKPCPECVAPTVCIRETPEGQRYTDPQCLCEPPLILTIEGTCEDSENVASGSQAASAPIWPWILVAVGAIVLIAIVIVVCIFCRFKPPEDTEMSNM